MPGAGGQKPSASLHRALCHHARSAPRQSQAGQPATPGAIGHRNTYTSSASAEKRSSRRERIVPQLHAKPARWPARSLALMTIATGFELIAPLSKVSV